MKIVLASESQFRKRAMDILGLPYEIRPSQIDERTGQLQFRDGTPRKPPDRLLRQQGIDI